MPKICQCAAVCEVYCPHRFPHDHINGHGCSELGCKEQDVSSYTSMLAENKEYISKYQLHWGLKCVDYEYWMSTTNENVQMTVKDTFYENYTRNLKILSEEADKRWEQKTRWERQRELDRMREERRDTSWQ